jgi:hypothetical protein
MNFSANIQIFLDIIQSTFVFFIIRIAHNDGAADVPLLDLQGWVWRHGQQHFV